MTVCGSCSAIRPARHHLPVGAFPLHRRARPDGRVTLDFNRAAENPPCAYNPWTTCPLPPSANRLQVRIEAGEKRYHAEATSNAAVLRK